MASLIHAAPPPLALANNRNLKNLEMLNPALMQTKLMQGDSDEPLSPATPAGKRKATWDSPCCSTALPSPWAGPDSPSPWPSPAPGSWASPVAAHGTPGSFRPQAHLSCATFVPSDLTGCLEMDFVEAMALRLPPVPEGTMRPDSPGDSDVVFMSPDSWNSMTPPPIWSPVAPIVDSEMQVTPPASPLASSRDVAPVTPFKPVRYRSPGAPCKAAVPRLLSALQCWDLAGVQQALENDPDCAQFPFWEHALEPPLCAAVRLGCGPEIIELLLAHGAAVNAVDAKGRAPFSILKADACRWGSVPFSDEPADGGRIADLLNKAGADETTGGEMEETSFAGGDHRTPLPAMPQFYSRSDTARKLF